MSDFEYIKVFSLAEALEFYSKYAPNARLLAGGVDLLLQIRQHVINPLYLIDLKGIPNLNSITYKDGSLNIGASTTLRDIEKSQMILSKFPALAEAAHQIAAIQIRNIATLGGNLCQSIKCPYYNQSHVNLFMRQSIQPCFKMGGNICHVRTWGRDTCHAILDTTYCLAPLASDMAIVLAALGGRLELAAKSGAREVNVDDFYRKDGEPKIAPKDILTRIKIPTNNTGAMAFLSYKASLGSYSLVSVAVSLILEDDKETCQDIKVRLGGVAPQPYKAKDVEEYVRSKRLGKAVIEKASQLLFGNIDLSDQTTMFKVTKARALCREALRKSLERGQEQLT
jgi:xanthine dehydrogenase YagS FAD-binding subunit